MAKDIAAKIKQLRLQHGWNQQQLADRLGVTQASVSRWEKGSIPEGRTLAQLADLAGETVASFIRHSPSDGASSLLVNRFFVRGTVAAGVWAMAYEWPREDWSPYVGGAHVEAPEGQRFGLRVEGESMNQVYPHGTILDCISLEAAGGEVHSGQRVIVERHKVDGEVEATVKEYFLADDGATWLVPRSSNPAFQSPISATDPGPGIAEVRVVAVVVGSYRPE